jgi:hypothetical protein
MTNFVHCRGCGTQIHETAPTCPKCGAPQNLAVPAGTAKTASDIAQLGYAAVPWFRRRWLVLLCLVSFTPVASYLAWSGDVFYQVKGGEVKTFPANIKRGLMIATAPWLLYIINSDNSSGVLAGLALVVMAIVLAFKK